MTKKLFLPLFIFILFIGTFLRFYQLGQTPNSLNWDEVSWGYNAYSVLQTGHDEYGNWLPMSFRAFGDFKQPMYVYLSTIPISFFDLTPFAVRFPSAFFGSLTIFIVYLMTYELFRKHREAKTVALLAMLFFAVSPWSVNFSRVAYEANVGLFFIIVGTWLFLRGLSLTRVWYLFAGAISLSLSAYTYHSDKLFAPILFVALLIYGWKYFIKRKTLVVLLLVVVFICNLFWVIDSRTTQRGRGVLFTANQTQILQPYLPEMNYDRQHNDPLGVALHNRRIIYVQEYIKNYFMHFNPNWLYITGDNPRHHTPGMGLLYLANLPFLLLGIVYLLRKRIGIAALLFFWLFFAPTASALAVEAPNASRSLIFLPTWHIFEAVGWWYAFSHVTIKRFRYLFVLPILLLLFNIVYFVHQYFVHNNTETQKDWQYGYKEAVQAVDPYRNTDKRIIFSKDFEQPYIFYLFYTKYDPKAYIASGGSERISKKCFTIENAYFGDCKEKLRSGDIFISLGEFAGFQGQTIKKIPYAYGSTAVTIYQQQ